MDATTTGQCACGAVRYSAEGAPVMAFHCQCRDCQRSSGGGHASLMVYPRAALQVTGTLKFHRVIADSGKPAQRGFCPECGSPVVGMPESRPTMMAIYAATLDDPSVFTPKAVLYTRSGHSWDDVGPALMRFEGMPPGHG